jgi:hypothetical protein
VPCNTIDDPAHIVGVVVAAVAVGFGFIVISALRAAFVVPVHLASLIADNAYEYVPAAVGSGVIEYDDALIAAGVTVLVAVPV